MCSGHVVRSIELIQCKEVYYLTVHHILRRDYRTDFAINLLRKAREFQIECDVRLTDITLYEHKGVDTHISPVKLPVLKKRFIKLA